MESSTLVALLSPISQLILLILLLLLLRHQQHPLLRRPPFPLLPRTRRHPLPPLPLPQTPQAPPPLLRPPPLPPLPRLLQVLLPHVLLHLRVALLFTRALIRVSRPSQSLRLAIGLFRLATGANYSQISTHFRVSESVARFCSKQLCRVLCTNYRFWTEFPTKAELVKVSAGFEAHTGLPNCCGVIECVRFLVVRHNGVGEERVAAQIMSDASCRILSIVAGFRGSKSDETVLKCSTLYENIESGELLDSEAVSVDGVAVNQYLVGGEGYPLLPWLMVPYVDAMPGSNEEQFNAAHSRMRLSGLRVVDSLKNWGVFSRPICEEMKMAVAYIGACSILHNGLLIREDYSAMSDGLDDDSLYDESSQCYRWDTSLEENSIERKASAIRNALATKAKQFQESIFSTTSSSLASLQST